MVMTVTIAIAVSISILIGSTVGIASSSTIAADITMLLGSITRGVADLVLPIKSSILLCMSSQIIRNNTCEVDALHAIRIIVV